MLLKIAHNGLAYSDGVVGFTTGLHRVFFMLHIRMSCDPFLSDSVYAILHIHIYPIFSHNKLILISVQSQTPTRNLLRARDGTLVGTRELDEPA